jgi:hypothetical protein
MTTKTAKWKNGGLYAAVEVFAANSRHHFSLYVYEMIAVNGTFIKGYYWKLLQLNADEVSWIQTFLDLKCKRVIHKGIYWCVNAELFQLMKDLAKDTDFLHLMFANSLPSIEMKELQKLVKLRDKLLR